MRRLGPGAIAVLAVGASTAGAQGLGDVAGRERERRQEAEAQGQSGAAPTFTTEDLGGAGGLYTSPEGDFRVRFPGQPEVVHRPFEGGGSQTGFRLAYSGIALSVSVTELTVAEVESRSVDQLLGDIRKVSLGSLGGAELVSERPITAGGRGGREFVVRFRARGSGREGVAVQHAYVAGTRAYVLMVMAPPGREDDATARVFLESFEIVSAGS